MKIPESIINAWNDRQGAVVLATTDHNSVPNIIYASCVSLHKDEFVVIADNYFCKTRENLKRKGKGAVLFITSANKAFQIKGTIEYHTSGEVYDEMKRTLPAKFPGHAAAVILVEEIYSGAEKLL